MSPLSYDELANEIAERLRSEETLILATCANNKVTARSMCHINDGLTILFATSIKSLKVAQIQQNPNIALAIGNLKIEAAAELFGNPNGYPLFVAEYPKKFPHLGDLYESTPDDVLVIARPTKIALFKYIDGPCEDVLEVEEKKAYRLGPD